MLKSLLESRMKKDSLSARDVAKKVGVAHTTILRALRGEMVDLETLIKISNWLGVLPATLLNSASDTKVTLASQIASVLERDPLLAKVFGDAIQRILKEDVDPEVIREIAAYAAYRLNLEKPQKGLNNLNVVTS